jgi:hypothetical protein
MTKEELNEMIELFGTDRIPNPDHYPMRFKFLVESFRHYKNMQNYKLPQKGS